MSVPPLTFPVKDIALVDSPRERLERMVSSRAVEGSLSSSSLVN